MATVSGSAPHFTRTSLAVRPLAVNLVCIDEQPEGGILPAKQIHIGPHRAPAPNW